MGADTGDGGNNIEYIARELYFEHDMFFPSAKFIELLGSSHDVFEKEPWENHNNDYLRYNARVFVNGGEVFLLSGVDRVQIVGIKDRVLALEERIRDNYGELITTPEYEPVLSKE